MGNASGQAGKVPARRKWPVLSTVILLSILAGWGCAGHQNAPEPSITATAPIEPENTRAIVPTNTEARTMEPERRSQIALARQLAAQARLSFAQQDVDQMTAVLLAIESMRLHPNVSASELLTDNQFAYPVSQVIHGGPVSLVAFSPDGKYLVTAGEHDNTVRVSDVETGKELARVVHDYGAWAADISPDSRYVVSGGGDSTARVWEIGTGKQITTLLHGGMVWTVAFSPDGKYVISSSADNITRIWEAQTGREIAHLTRGERAPFVSFSPDGSYLIDNATTVTWNTPGEEFPRVTLAMDIFAVSADGRYIASTSCDKVDQSSACAQGSIRVYETDTGREVSHIVHDGGVRSLAFSPDNKYLLSGSYKNLAQLWDVQTGKEVLRKAHDGWYVSSVVFTSDGKSVASGGGSTVRAWQIPSGVELARAIHDMGVNAADLSSDGNLIAAGGGFVARVWKIDDRLIVADGLHSAEVTCAASSPDGTYIASGDADGTARVWETETGRQVSQVRHDEAVSSIAFSPDGKYVVSGGYDQTVRVWEIATGKEVAQIAHASEVRAVAFSSSGRYVVSVSGENLVRVLEAQTGEEVSRMVHEAGAAVAAFSPDGRLVVSGGCDLIGASGACSVGSARVWEAQTGKELARMSHDYIVETAAFSPDGKYVVSSGDQTARVWAADTGQEIARMTHETGARAAFSPDGKYVISAGGVIASLWEANTGREIHSLKHDHFVYSVAFSSDGKYIVTLEINKNTIHVWESDSGEEIARLTPEGGVLSLSFSSDNQYLLVRGRDHAVHVWMYRPEDLIADACMKVTRNLTLEEWEQFIGDALPHQAVCPDLPLEPELHPFDITLPTSIPTETLIPISTP